jgi:nucleotide-binding universal stress UspA family protein
MIAPTTHEAHEVPGGFAIRRIVVAADSSAQGQAALEAAADLGARLHAEVEGVFVEDIDLVNLAALPLGREVHLISGAARALDTDTLETQLRAEASQARRALKLLTDRARVTSSFRVVRGRVDAEIMTAAGGGDLLVIGIYSRAVGPRSRPGSMALAAARAGPRSVLLLRAGARVTGRVLVAFDGSEGAEKALDAGARLTGNTVDGLSVLLTADTPSRADELQARVRAALLLWGISPKFLRTPRLDLDDMCRLSHEAGAEILVLDAGHPVLADDAHGRLLEQISCPVLLVR